MVIDEAGFTPKFFKQSNNIRTYQPCSYLVEHLNSSDLFDGELDVGNIEITEGLKSQKDAMATLEDEQDVAAAKIVIAESRADKAEFDESKNVNAGESIFQSNLDKKLSMKSILSSSARLFIHGSHLRDSCFRVRWRRSPPVEALEDLFHSKWL
ncbi:unnamed protein product [Cylicocyclus nassatus]|uniref:Uncharacterized protein n=1 Tax=Cylicocyclus nassatus TaxID=53992 RepID=A0AA36HBZ8_CYLNA|nr:unnamed protein product [Cylicocyclus nassatus]